MGTSGPGLTRLCPSHFLFYNKAVPNTAVAAASTGRVAQRCLKLSTPCFDGIELPLYATPTSRMLLRTMI